MEHTRLPYIVRIAAILIVLVLLVTVLYYLKIVLVPLLFSIIFAVIHLGVFGRKLGRTDSTT